MIAKRLIATDIHFFCFFVFFSKPMMDLLVMLCAKYHLNPSGHTIELITTNRNHVKFKPNALIGALDPEKILLKQKGMEDKSKKTGPQMPEVFIEYRNILHSTHTISISTSNNNTKYYYLKKLININDIY